MVMTVEICLAMFKFPLLFTKVRDVEKININCRYKAVGRVIKSKV